MVDILKITSSIATRKIQNTSKHQATDAIFDLENPKSAVEKKDSDGEKESKQAQLNDLNKEIFKPLLKDVNAQSMTMRKFVMLAKLFEYSSDNISDDLIYKMFTRPSELFDELLTRENAATIFKGDFFDSLRVLAKIDGQPKLREAILSILKYFDCIVKEKNSLQSIIIQSQLLSESILKDNRLELQQHIEYLDSDESYHEINKYIKNKFIPFIAELAKKYQGSEKISNTIMSIIQNIARFDKADPKLLEEAVTQLGKELKHLTSLNDEGVKEMKKLVFEHAEKSKDLNTKESMATLLNKALDKEGSLKINNAAQNLLLNILESESPIMSLMHYMIPLRYLDENTYGEFFIDKDCSDKKGGEKGSKNIFFTIQSDKYGDFEVDLIETDKLIDLSIKCPDIMVKNIKEIKQKIKKIIEEQGYSLMNYEVEPYTENQTILKRFPKLARRKVGFDVKI